MPTVPILIAQHDQLQMLELTHAMGRAGYAPDCASDGPTVLRKAKAADFRLLLLDMDLEEQDGPAVCARLREEGKQTPVIFVSSVAETQQKVRAFKSGADDYVTRPYEPQELILRIEAVLRRARPERNASAVECIVGPSTVDLNTGRGTRDGKPVALTGKELELLHYLHDRPNQIIPRDELLREVWRYASTDTRTLDMHMSTLRQKLEMNSHNPQHLITIRRRGYMFK
jgi:two-component system alkaline phosphatase synthesis response regulator PhoP